MQSLQLQCCDCWCTGDGYNWGICKHNILSGLLSLLKLKCTLTLLSQKRHYNAKFAFCHVMTADDVLKCGPTGISGHNCIYLKIYISKCICWYGTNCTCLNIVTQSMFVERAHSYFLKDIMAGIYWLVELRPGASAKIISVCNWIFHITSRFSQKDDRLQILHFQCYDCWWTGVTCGLI